MLSNRYESFNVSAVQAAAARFGVWMVVAPALLIMSDDPLVGRWLQNHIELIAFLLALTIWGLRA